MSINFGTQVNVTQATDSQPALSSDQFGLRTPKHNAAFAALDAAAVAANQVVTYYVVEFDLNNNFNAGTGRFTAPVAGNYFFKYYQLMTYASSAQGEYRIGFRYNGTLINYARTIDQKGEGNAWQTLQLEAVVKMQAGDYLEVFFISGPAALARDAAQYSAFQGYRL